MSVNLDDVTLPDKLADAPFKDRDCEVVGAYREANNDESSIRFILKECDQDNPALARMVQVTQDGNIGGGQYIKARILKRCVETDPGETFMYNNTSFKRLEDKKVSKLASQCFPIRTKSGELAELDLMGWASATTATD